MRLIIFLFVAILTSSLIAQTTDNKLTHFRDVEFDKTVAEVKAIEKNKLLTELEGDNNGLILIYNGTVVGYNFYIKYFFINDRLLAGELKYSEKHTSKNIYIERYNSLATKLSRKYGEPSKKKVTWRDDLYRDDPDEYGFAVSLGHLRYHSRWDYDNGTIALILNGDNYEVDLSILYIMDEYYEIQEQNESDEL